ncbi:hypothetical protein Tco_0145275 [Tanacetum coccineum]
MDNPLVLTEMELVLEQTQQGTSHEVSIVDIEKEAISSSLRLLKSNVHYRSDTYVITMKMEILPVSTSNITAIEQAEYDESNTYVLERFNTTAGNPIKETLLKLSLPDHRLILKDLKIHINMDMENQEKYEHVGPKVTSTQDGKRSQDDDKRLCLVDDIKKLKITYKSSLKEQAQA